MTFKYIPNPTGGTPIDLYPGIDPTGCAEIVGCLTNTGTNTLGCKPDGNGKSMFVFMFSIKLITLRMKYREGV